MNARIRVRALKYTAAVVVPLAGLGVAASVAIAAEGPPSTAPVSQTSAGGTPSRENFAPTAMGEAARTIDWALGQSYVEFAAKTRTTLTGQLSKQGLDCLEPGAVSETQLRLRASGAVGASSNVASNEVRVGLSALATCVDNTLRAIDTGKWFAFSSTKGAPDMPQLKSALQHLSTVAREEAPNPNELRLAVTQALEALKNVDTDNRQELLLYDQMDKGFLLVLLEGLLATGGSLIARSLYYPEQGHWF